MEYQFAIPDSHRTFSIAMVAMYLICAKSINSNKVGRYHIVLYNSGKKHVRTYGRFRTQQ